MSGVLDIHFGKRLRGCRVEQGISLGKLARISRISLENLQRYEEGLVRASVEDLYRLSRALDVSIVYFYRDLLAGVQQTEPKKNHS